MNSRVLITQQFLSKSITMKAAVTYQKEQIPQYADFPEPSVENDEQLLISVKAAAIKHLDKSRASGKHYSADKDSISATVIGGDGVGLLGDGTRVFAIGVTGMVAEKAVIEKSRMVKLPDRIDDLIAAALPNAVAGSAMALRFRACMQKGDTVLINGATGFTGRVAVQIAKHYGAKKIIATGRNEWSLQSLLALGADEVIPLKLGDQEFMAQIKAQHDLTPIDIIIDYLWGHSATLILASLKGRGSFTHKTRFVSVGAVTGDVIELSAGNLRSVDLQISGSGLGSWNKDEMQKLFSEILPEMFQLAAENKLKIGTVEVRLKDIGTIWDMDVPDGKRLVVTI
jgi:NADPH:quinone reductase-like Zn-dependent oxidoreductase